MYEMKYTRTFLVAQWLRLRIPNAGGTGSIPGKGTRSHMHATTKSSHATTKSSHSRTKEPTRVLQLRSQ